jgi:membrane-associated protein
MFILFFASIAGDTVNYQVGQLLRNDVASHDNIRFIKREHRDRTHIFFEKHGAKTIIIALFVPIIRSFAPFVAGVGIMPYSKFISYNVIGGIAWVCAFLLEGYFFGNLPNVKDNFSFVILGIIFDSLLPGFITYIQSGND